MPDINSHHFLYSPSFSYQDLDILNHTTRILQRPEHDLYPRHSFRDHIRRQMREARRLQLAPIDTACCHILPTPPATLSLSPSLNAGSDISPVLSNACSDKCSASPAAAFLSLFSSLPPPPTDSEGVQVGDHILGRVLGLGAFSVVREAHPASPNASLCAVKILRHPDPSANSHLIHRELRIWRLLDHPSILRLEKVELHHESAFLFMEYHPRNLLQHLQEHGSPGLGEVESRRLWRDVCQAVEYLHREVGVCHRDIKLENVLIDSRGRVKLADFGLAEFLGEKASFVDNPRQEVVLGSLAYTAPEQLRATCAVRCPLTDVWSLGVVLYALVTGRLPFWDDFEPRLQYKILTGRYTEPDHASPSLSELLRGLFSVSPEQRWTISQVLSSGWLAGV
ncbi:uncharacterized protein VTP21DRAFT_10921 [Calcarisporiella thermophila]|uniref:uncharacterized protein n=1 Tax=Calcarisporiella thermophila TaxID=911321 RepID=UPI00374334AA